MRHDSYHGMKQGQIQYTRGNQKAIRYYYQQVSKYGKVLDFFKQLMSFGIFIGLIFLVYLYWGQSLEDITDTSILNKFGFFISKVIYYIFIAIFIFLGFLLGLFVLMAFFR